MSNNKDMKKELRKLCDSFFQSEDEEKLVKELKDNLEKFFKVINDKYGKNFNLDDDANKFLKEFSPWHQKRGEKLIEDFEKIVNQNSNKDFSWLDILEKDEQWKKTWEKSNEEVKIKEEVTDKNKHVNMRYQIPTHFHGDIDNAVLFYCMENPRGYINDSEMDRWVKDQMSGKLTMNDYYKQTAELRDEPWKDKTIKKIIEERYQLNDITTDSIETIIYSDAKEDSPLTRELKTMFSKFKTPDYKIYDFRKGSPDLKDFYYFKNYYKQLLLKDSNLKPFQQEENQNKAIEIANKICNVEIYPFSSSDPKLKGIGKTILLNSDLSRLSAYIILRRIYRYLNSPKVNPKPIIVLRKYASAWEQLFVEIFKEVKEKDQSFDNKLVLSLLEKGFFYCQTGQQGGGITSGNVISIKNYKIFQKVFQNLKKAAFEEIMDVLHRGEIDKNSLGKTGDL